MRGRYDVIVLDTPPCNMMTDATEAGQFADAAMMVIRQNFASRNSVVAALNSINEIDLPMLGYVLNAFGGKRGGKYGYGYGEKNKENED